MDFNLENIASFVSLFGTACGLVSRVPQVYKVYKSQSANDLSTNTIIILGLASILSDGFSMGISSFLAEKARLYNQNAYKVGIVTFLSFIIVGMFPLIPFLTI